jgi:hypothetical protein
MVPANVQLKMNAAGKRTIEGSGKCYRYHADAPTHRMRGLYEVIDVNGQ